MFSIKEASELGFALKAEMEKVLVGRSDTIQKLLSALFAGGHVLLDDIPGTGKTLLSRSLASCLSLPFHRIQFTPDLLPGDILGSSIYRTKEERFEFIEGPIFSGVVLADEINRATPRTQSALLEAMEEKQVTVEGETRALPKPFFVVATQNPIESAGTFPLPEAQLDRFLMSLTPGYPSAEDEAKMLARFLHDDPLARLTPVAGAQSILDAQCMARGIEVSAELQRYIVALVSSTRTQEGVLLGASPRAALALMRAAQARAMLAGREYVIPDDVKAFAADVLAHRLVMNVFEPGAAKKAVLTAVEKTGVPKES